MTTVKIVRLLHLLSYLCVTSQALFYLIVFSDALKLIPLDNFLEQRKAVEQIIASRYTMIYLACLILSLAVIFLSLRHTHTDRIFLLTSIIALLCLVADLSIALYGNIPINKQIANLTEQITLSQWEDLRSDWLRFFRYRGLFTAAGMVTLLIGLIVEKKIE